MCSLLPSAVYAQHAPKPLLEEINRLTEEIEREAIDWRRDFHQHPELSNREYRTAGIVAEHLRSLGMEVQTGVAKTGVVGLLRGPENGPVVALRADMDALPITEETGLPFASTVTATFQGQEVGVMHACGHDVHTSSLMGVASVLAEIRDKLPGSVKFIFQPAEEGAFDYDIWGAKMMVAEGVLQDPRPDAIFGMHVWPFPTGTIAYTRGPIMASVDNFSIRVIGRGGHAAAPWETADPIVAAAHMVTGIQTLVSRNAELTKGAAVISIGSFRGGNRNNIIPDDVELLGTIRTHNEETRQLIHQRLETFIHNTAEAFGTSAEITIDRLYPAVINNPELVNNMIAVIEHSVGQKHVMEMDPLMIAEDFSYYANEIPGMFYMLGIIAPDHTGPIEPIHSPRFDVDESAIAIAMRTMSYLAVEALFQLRD
ncbi:MAG: amidohydrolase [Bacteroidia bacterium]|nr:MAG: amidohydrolase [Bacteroidia bacterium]